PEQELVPTQAQAGQPERGTERRCLAPPPTRGPAVRTHVDPGPRGGDLERSDAREPVLGLSGGPAGVGLRLCFRGLRDRQLGEVSRLRPTGLPCATRWGSGSARPA